MKFNELDAKMRIYETNQDHVVLPEMYMVARIDGRNFTTLTKDREKFEAPFDTRFRDYMVETVKHLMNCGFRVVYGYTESDEISLLFSLNEAAFSRKTRKYNSILAGEASAKFSLLLGSIGAFDCRISELPSKSAVVDYFRWRNEDASRNALNAHCYWIQRKQGAGVAKATSYLEGLSISDKNEFLFQQGINFNELPKWQRRGIGIYWKQQEKEGFNPITKETTKTIRRKLQVDYDLPMKDEYSEFIRKFLNE